MSTFPSTLMQSLVSGLAGATTLTAIHETARRMTSDAPRMDVIGQRALSRGLKAIGRTPPRGEELQQAALAGDLVSNTLFYALIGSGDPHRPVLRGAALGALAGLGALVLPPVLGLGRAPRGLEPKTQSMTFSWYLAGGLAAGLTYKCLQALSHRAHRTDWVARKMAESPQPKVRKWEMMPNRG